MDIVAYGGAAVGMAVAVTEFIQGSITLSGAICIVLLASEFFLPSSAWLILSYCNEWNGRQ